jgi:hypothetical protein
LEEVNLRKGVAHRLTYINVNLTMEQKEQVVGLLNEFTGCFAWEYTKMPGLSREVVEHTLPIKGAFKPYRQQPRNFNHELLGHIKEEIECLLEAKFIIPYCYAEWVSNVIPIEKENTKKIRVCVDYRNLIGLPQRTSIRCP